MKNFFNFLRKNWKAITATGLSVAALLGVTALVIFFPPALPAILGFTVGGFALFGFMSGFGVLASALTLGAIAAGAVLLSATLFNAATKVANWLDKFITPAAPASGRRPYEPLQTNSNSSSTRLIPVQQNSNDTSTAQSVQPGSTSNSSSFTL